MLHRTSATAAAACVIAAAVAATVILEQPVEPDTTAPAVTLSLPERRNKIARMKFVDPITGAPRTVNRVLEGPGADATLTDEQVSIRMRDDYTRYIQRVGAITRRFHQKVTQTAAQDPNRLLRSALWLKFDPAKLPSRPPASYLRSLTVSQEDEVSKRFVAHVRDAIGRVTSPAHSLAISYGGQNVRSSSIAPLLVADLPAYAILQLSRRTDVIALILDGGNKVEDELGTSACTIAAPNVTARGISASWVEVAVVDKGKVDPGLSCLRVKTTCGRGIVASHATRVAGVVASSLANRLGVAPLANIVSAPLGDFGLADIVDAISCAFDNSADVFNLSFGTSESGEIEAEDMALDFFVRYLSRTMVKSAGNQSNTCSNTNEVTSPGLAWNVITVGNFTDAGTCARADDAINSDSCYGDPASPHGDRQKPEVAAPGTSITMPTTGAAGTCPVQARSGTSFAAPHVSAAAALLIDRRHDLKWQPEGIKALLMASAFNNVSSGSRLSERDGAGGVDVDRADQIITTGTWMAKEVRRDEFDARGKLDFASIRVPPGSTRLKMALAWNADPAVFDFDGFYLKADLDIHLLKDGASVAGSASWDNNYETIDIVNPAPGVYNVHLYQFRFDNEAEPVGIAWRVE